MKSQSLAVALVCVVAAACATSSRAVTSGPLRWSGDFRKPSGYNSAMMVPNATTASASAYGSITLTPDPDAAERTQVDLSITVPGAIGSQIAWAVFMGPCGSSGPLVTGPNEFPPLDVGGSGSATFRAPVAFGMDEHSTYHANVYNTGHVTDQGDVMMCANLERQGSR